MKHFKSLFLVIASKKQRPEELLMSRRVWSPLVTWVVGSGFLRSGLVGSGLLGSGLIGSGLISSGLVSSGLVSRLHLLWGSGQVSFLADK